MHAFEEATPAAVSDVFRRLLTEKHLYQCVEVDTGFVAKIAAVLYEDYIACSGPRTSSMPDLEDIQNEGMQVLDRQWLPLDPTLLAEPSCSDSEIRFTLPTIHTFCQECDERWPFNPVYEGMSCPGCEKTTDQWFFLAYQCQSCKSLAIRFLVRREGLKLKLSGRDPLEVVPLPKFLPKAHSKYYSNALIAHHAGQTLAGLFLLRVFIEQFWRSLPAAEALLKQDPRATGEKQGEAYQGTLSVDFRSRFPSLSEVYGRLSAAMHSAEVTADLFDDSCRKIEEHFDARRVYKIS
jgi:hypothetical protein